MKREGKIKRIGARLTESDANDLYDLCKEFGMNKSQMIGCLIREKKAEIKKNQGDSYDNYGGDWGYKDTDDYEDYY